MSDLSGRLTMVQHGWERRLDFLDGRVVYASSLVPGERLATWLAASGLLDAGRLRRLLAVSLLRRTLFTDLLVEEPDVSVEEIRRGLADLAQTVVTRTFSGAVVEVSFDPSYPVRNLLHLDLALDPQSLALEAARRTDESPPTPLPAADDMLPLAGEAFERFFWELIRSGVSAEDPLDGERFATLHRVVHDVMGTLAQWLASSPGLVPLPADQVADIGAALAGSEAPPLVGLPHAAWNQMVLACSVRSGALSRPSTLDELAETAGRLDVWNEMIGTERWRRPPAGKLDQLSRSVVTSWTVGAEAAASVLGVEPRESALGAHLLAVPTDLVLWVLATVDVPHQGLRLTLLRELPRRLLVGLALLADLPATFRRLATGVERSPLAVALDIARRALPSAGVWIATVVENEDLTCEGVSDTDVEAATLAAREALEGCPGGRS